MTDRRISVGGNQGRGDPPLRRDHDDPFATWRAEDEAKDPAARRLVAWIALVVIAALAVGAAWLGMGRVS